MRSIVEKPAAKPPYVRGANERDWNEFRDEEPEESPPHVVVRSLVGALASTGGDGPAYTLTPEPMTEEPQIDAQGRPRSVWSALLCLDPDAYAQLVTLVQEGCPKHEAAGVLADAMLWEATQTRRWERGPDGEWRVWVDREGKAKVSVWP